MSTGAPLATFPASASRQMQHDNTGRRGLVPVVINLVFLAIATSVGLFRLYTRAFVSKVFGSDDVFIVFAILFTIANGIEVQVASTKYYFDHHIWELPDDVVAESKNFTYIHNILFIMAANNTHISWMCFYYRLSSNAGVEWFRKTLHTSVGIIMGLFTVYLALAIRLCLPIRAVWAWPPIENASCVRRAEVIFSGGIVKILIDVLLIALPYLLISKLKLTPRERFAVLSLFSLGILIAIFGSLRSYYVWQIYFRTGDFTWYAYWAYFWSAMEHYIGVICACIPPLRPLSNAAIQRLIRASPTAARGLAPVPMTKESTVVDPPRASSVAKPKSSITLETESTEEMSLK